LYFVDSTTFPSLNSLVILPTELPPSPQFIKHKRTSCCKTLNFPIQLHHNLIHHNPTTNKQTIPNLSRSEKVTINCPIFFFSHSNALFFLINSSSNKQFHPYSPSSYIITRSSFWKCSYINDAIKGGLMMWVSFAMDKNKQEGKWLTMECNASKWIKANNAFSKGSPSQVPIAKGMIVTFLHGYDDYKTRETQMHKMHEQRGWVVWCSHLLHKVLEIWPLLTPNWRHLPCLIGEQPNWGEGLRCT